MPDRTAILVLIDLLYEQGGTEKFLLQLLAGLDRQRFTPLVCPLQPLDSPMIRLLREQGIEVMPLGIDRLLSLHALRCAWRLRRLIKSRGIRIVQTIHFASDLLGALCRGIWGSPALISCRRDMGFKENGRRHLLLRRITNRRMSRIVGNSAAMIDRLAAHEGIAAARLQLIRSGVEASALPDRARRAARRAGLRAGLGLPAGHPLIGCVANIMPIKGHQYLIEATALLRQRGVPVQLLLIGGYHEDEGAFNGHFAMLKQRITTLGLQQSVHFLGHRPDAANLVGLLDIFVLPSLSEGFSNALLEAMAAGVPAVATAVGGNPEAVIDGQTGLLVPPGEAGAIADALERLLADPRRRRQMGAASHQRVLECFQLPQMVQTWEALYESLAGAADRQEGKGEEQPCSR